ncbi:MAG: phosphate-starvation-inducible PsiE family protein [Cyanobacteria bacterium P01_A01_bin.105]
MANRWKRYIAWRASDEGFLQGTSKFETLVSKFLAITMLVVIIVIMVDLVRFLAIALFEPSAQGFFATTLSEIFGLFLSVLIALEILENITAYLKRHVVQVELVIVTSLTAVARKIIILDLDKITGVQLLGLSFSIFALSISYWIVRNLHRTRSH